VLQQSRREQVPWESNSTVGDFYFVPLVKHPTGPTKAQLEATVWEGIQDSLRASDFSAFLKKFPTGAYAELAKAKLANLQRASENVVVSNLAEPWKALQQDKLETDEEFAARVSALGAVKVGTVMVSLDNYNLKRRRLVLPLQTDAWAKPYVKAGSVVLTLDRAQMRQLVAAGDSATVATRFEIKDGRPQPGGLTLSTAVGSFTPSPELTPVVGAFRNSFGLWETEARTGRVDLALVQVPAGSFSMGTHATDSDQNVNNLLNLYRPVHDVTISRDFWMGKFSVTQGQWQAVMGNNPSEFKNAGSDASVEQVSWYDAQGFIGKLNGMQTQWTFRLPTEAEWEYACRAGTEGERYGDLNAIAWYKGNSDSTTHPVGQKQPNAFGLYDMNGNVWQWCQDWHGDYASVSQTDPMGPSSGKLRVLRGGSWVDDGMLVRSASRNYFPPDFRVGCFGFRVVALARAQ
jgi:formylglycine-generating enzyme required for sulfatase activity